MTSGGRELSNLLQSRADFVNAGLTLKISAEVDAENEDERCRTGQSPPCNPGARAFAIEGARTRSADRPEPEAGDISGIAWQR